MMQQHNADIAEVMKRAKLRFPLSRKGIHGVAHWQRVHENGSRLAKRNGADQRIVELFAWLHDCCRETDGGDIEHGPRAAVFAESLRGDVLHLDDDAFELLREAIHGHTTGHRHSNLTIGTCWDADRLDIGRVGGKPHPHYLSTEAAREKHMINWAYARSRQA